MVFSAWADAVTVSVMVVTCPPTPLAQGVQVVAGSAITVVVICLLPKPIKDPKFFLMLRLALRDDVSLKSYLE